MSHCASKPAPGIALLLTVVSLGGLGACSAPAEKPVPADSVSTVAASTPNLAVVTVAETFITPFDSSHNVDSPAFYTTPTGETWILATAKTPNFVLVNDAQTGKD